VAPPPPMFGAAVRFDDRIHQSGGVSAKRLSPAAFSMLFFLMWTVAGSEMRR